MPAIPPHALRENGESGESQKKAAPPSAAEQAIIGDGVAEDDLSKPEKGQAEEAKEANGTNPPPHEDGQGSTDDTAIQDVQAAKSTDDVANQDVQAAKKQPPLQVLPTPLLRFQIHDLSHPGTHALLTNINITTAVRDAVDTVCRILYNAATPPSSSDSSTTNTVPTPKPTPPHQPPIPQIRSLTLFLDNMDGVAYTTGMPLDTAFHKEIHLSLSYITHVASRPASASGAIAHELTGVLVHETVHALQHNGNGTAPGGLIEGMADYVRLKAGLGASHWKRPMRREEVQHSWDAGYERTAWFLEWLESRGENGSGGEGRGLVVRMNEWLGAEGREYGEEVFWRELCGKSVGELWEEYVGWVEEEGEMAEAIRLSLEGEEGT